MIESTAPARPASEALFRRATEVLPGGVSSPVRAFGAVGGTPLAFQRAGGAEIVDEDGGRYVDFVGSWGPLILGHAQQDVLAAVSEQLDRGTTYGAPHRLEVELAELIVDWYPGAEQVRFVSSGTEAVMSAVRLARGVTGRDLIVKFDGCYHGHVDHLLVSAGSGLATFGTPSSAGVPEPFAGLTKVLPLDDESALADLFSAEGERIAAVIVEPVPANNGLLLQRPEFLQALRDQATEHGALLIFDEVISGFRMGRGGAAEHYGITPDLSTFGKVIGGGFPVGAFAGSREHMAHLSPQGPVYQAGTLSGNPVAMAAGLKTLRLLQERDAWRALENLGGHLEEEIQRVRAATGLPFAFARTGSLFWMCLQDSDPPRRPDAITPEAARRYRKLFHGLLQRGYYIAPSGYEVGFLSLAHTPKQVTAFADALAAVLPSCYQTA